MDATAKGKGWREATATNEVRGNGHSFPEPGYKPERKGRSRLTHPAVPAPLRRRGFDVISDSPPREGWLQAGVGSWAIEKDSIAHESGLFWAIAGLNPYSPQILRRIEDIITANGWSWFQCLENLRALNVLTIGTRIDIFPA